MYEFIDAGAETALYTITDIAWPLSMLLLLITGIVVARARVLEGWLRFTPLLAALWLPLSVVAMAVAGATAGQALGGLLTAVGWGMVGYAVRQRGQLTAAS